MERAAAMTTSPPSRDCAASSTWRPSATVLRIRSATGRNTVPARVRRTPRRERSKSRCPRARSRAATRALTDGWVRNRDAAALPKLPKVATARNASIWGRSTMIETFYGGDRENQFPLYGRSPYNARHKPASQGRRSAGRRGDPRPAPGPGRGGPHGRGGGLRRAPPPRVRPGAGAPPRPPRRAVGAHPRRRGAGLPPRDPGDPGGLLDRGAGPSRPARPARGDHGARGPQDDDQRPQLGGEHLHGRPRGRHLAHLGQPRERPGEPRGRRPGDDRLHVTGRPDLPARGARRHPAGAAAGVAPVGRPPPRGRPPRDRRPAGRGPVPLPQRRGAPQSGVGPLPLPPEAGEPPGGAAV